MPEDRPAAAELIDTVREFLEALRPFLAGYGAFQVRVAANLLAIARREVELGGRFRRGEQARLERLLGRSGTFDELESELVERIRNGELGVDSDALMSHLRVTAEEHLRIANPKYLSVG